MFEMTLPYPNYFPTKPSQTAIYRQVSFPVPLNLWLPERWVLFRQPETLGAPMPKAAIYKNRHLLFSKCEVWPSWDRQMPAPAPYSRFPEQHGQPDFRHLVPLAPDPGHDFRALFFGPDVGH